MIKYRKALKALTCYTCAGTIEAKQDYYRQTSTDPARCYCENCYGSGASDYLMWVGANFYPTIDAFVEEASIMGVCKRVPKIPSDIKPGISRVFLVHDEGKRPSDEEKEGGIKSYGKVFGFFPIMQVRLILDDPDAIAQYQAKLKNLPLEIIGYQEATTFPDRGCGHLIMGASYLVSAPDPEALREIAEPLADRSEIKGGMIIFREYLDVPEIARFRGIKSLDRGMIPPLDDLGISIGRHQMDQVEVYVDISGS